MKKSSGLTRFDWSIYGAGWLCVSSILFLKKRRDSLNTAIEDSLIRTYDTVSDLSRSDLLFKAKLVAASERMSERMSQRIGERMS